jgi:hypothetical protein
MAEGNTPNPGLQSAPQFASDQGIGLDIAYSIGLQCKDPLASKRDITAERKPQSVSKPKVSDLLIYLLVNP